MTVLAAVLTFIAGIVNPSADGGGTYQPAIRIPAVPVGLHGLPFAPEGLDDCDDARFYREQFGLPQRFDALAYRESRCTNTPISKTGCCVGALQLHHIIFRDHRMIDGLAACGATWFNVRGDDPLSKQRQFCAAKVLFDVDGYRPWAATT